MKAPRALLCILICISIRVDLLSHLLPRAQALLARRCALWAAARESARYVYYGRSRGVFFVSGVVVPNELKVMRRREAGVFWN